MPEIIIVPVEIIIEKNEDFTGVKCDRQRKRAVGSCYSSFYYYSTLQEQIASITGNLVKGHFFIDANKRTALYTYLLLSMLNGIRPVEDIYKQVEIFVALAEMDKDTAAYARLLFP